MGLTIDTGSHVFTVCTSRSDIEKTTIFQTATVLCMSVGTRLSSITWEDCKPIPGRVVSIAASVGKVVWNARPFQRLRKFCAQVSPLSARFPRFRVLSRFAQGLRCARRSNSLPLRTSLVLRSNNRQKVGLIACLSPTGPLVLPPALLS